jgi:hypothetical protein
MIRVLDAVYISLLVDGYATVDSARILVTFNDEVRHRAPNHSFMGRL